MDRCTINFVVYDSIEETRKNNYKDFLKFLKNYQKKNQNEYCEIMIDEMNTSEKDTYMICEVEEIKLDYDWDDLLEAVDRFFSHRNDYDNFMYDCIIIHSDDDIDPTRKFSYNKLIRVETRISGLLI